MNDGCSMSDGKSIFAVRRVFAKFKRRHAAIIIIIITLFGGISTAGFEVGRVGRLSIIYRYSEYHSNNNNIETIILLPP